MHEGQTFGRTDMKGGKNRVPDEAKRASGTYRPGTAQRVGNLAAAQPDPPAKLSAAAREEWDRIVPLLHDAKLTTLLDADALELYCELHAEWRSAPREFSAAKLGQLRLLMSELGLTAAGRVRVPKPAESFDACEFTPKALNVTSIANLLAKQEPKS
jgi:phage terminase small subunit